MKTPFLLLCRSICFLGASSCLNAQTPPPPQPDNTVRLMSYNIRNGQGTDNITDYTRIAEVILRVSPDVAALQELDSATARSGRTDVLSHLGNLTRMHAVYAAAIDFQNGTYGTGMLSKEKPLSWKRIPLPGREERRVLLLVEFGKYIVCCTHYSLHEADRLAASEIINREAEAFGKPAFLLGDFNAAPSSAAVSKLAERWKMLSDPGQPTFPADRPGETIDYIFGHVADGRTYSVHGRGVPNEPAASDHLPLFADIRVSADPSDILRTRPCLQNPATDAMTVMWHTRVPCYSWLEYGTDTLHLQRARTCIDGEVPANTTLHRIRLTGLRPGTKYYYRIYSREITYYGAYHKEFGATATTGTTSFTTPGDTATNFTAVIFNDLHNSCKLFDKLHAQVRDIPCDMVFFNGDCLADLQSEAEALRCIDCYGRKIGADSVPVIYLRGNHEIRGAGSMLLRNLLEPPGGRPFGAFNIGDTRFVLLDCGEDKPDTHPVYYDLNDFTQHRKDQAAFLEHEIASEAFQSAAQRVLIHHIPVYGNDDAYNPCRELWGETLAKADFSICLNGHTHTHRYLPKGTDGNRFPVIIGGGSTETTATVTVLKKRGKELHLTVLNAEGECLQQLSVGNFNRK